MNSNLIGLSFSWKEGEGSYVPVCGPPGSSYLPCARVLAELKPILEDPNVKKVGSYVVSSAVIDCCTMAMVAKRGSGGIPFT